MKRTSDRELREHGAQLFWMALEQATEPLSRDGVDQLMQGMAPDFAAAVGCDADLVYDRAHAAMVEWEKQTNNKGESDV